MNAPPVEQIFAEVLGLPIEKITDDLSYDTVPEWDSVSHVTLIAILDETFGLRIDAEDAGEMNSVGGTKRILAAKYGVR